MITLSLICFFFFFNDTATTEIYTLSLHDALPILGNTTVTARDRVAEIALNRGGTVKVCATSGLHLTAGKSADGAAVPIGLMLALGRGAIEGQMAATARDVGVTADLRFTIPRGGPVDPEVRVTRN